MKWKWPKIDIRKPFARYKEPNRVSTALKEVPNPDTIFRVIGGKYSALTELRNDPHLSSIIQSRKAGTLSLEWEFTYNEETEENKFIKEIFNYLDLNKIISEMLEAPLYGYKFMEIVWSLENGKYIPKDVIGKPCEWFTFDENNIPFFIQRDGKRLMVPMNKFLLLQHNPNYLNPYGESLLTKCYWPVFFKKNANKFWSIFIEKYGMPHILVEMLGMNDDDLDDSLEILENMIQDGISISNSNMKVTPMDFTKASSPMIFKEFMHVQNSEMSKIILSQTLTTEQGEVGSYAMSKTHLQVRSDVLDADRKMVENALNELVRKIYEINFGTSNDLPVFRLYQEEDVDKVLAERDAILYGNGFRFTKKYGMKTYGFEEDDFEIVDVTLAPQFSESDHSHDLDEDDTGINELMKANERMVNHAIKLISNVNSVDEVKGILENAYPQLDSSEIEEFTKTAILAAQAGGVFNADNE